MPTESRHVGPYERLVLLKAVSLWGSPPVEALAALAQQAEERRIAAGALVAEADKPWDHIYLVVEGRVGVYQNGERFSSAGPRESFGTLEVLSRFGSGLEMRAEEETLALELRSTTVLSVLEDHFSMTLDAIRALSRTLLATPSWLVRSANVRRVALPDVVSPDGLDLVDRIRMLHASDVFARTRLDSLAEVAAQFEEFRVDRDGVLWREGDAASWYLVLLDGRIESTSSEGLHFTFSRGTLPGLIEALGATPRWHDAIAATPVTGLRLGVERFLDAMEDDFVMANHVLAALASRVREQQQALGTASVGPHAQEERPR
jgi:CRP-like cAMP-binding protein